MEGIWDSHLNLYKRLEARWWKLEELRMAKWKEAEDGGTVEKRKRGSKVGDPMNFHEISKPFAR